MSSRVTTHLIPDVSPANLNSLQRKNRVVIQEFGYNNRVEDNDIMMQVTASSLYMLVIIESIDVMYCVHAFDFMQINFCRIASM